MGARRGVPSCLPEAFWFGRGFVMLRLVAVVVGGQRRPEFLPCRSAWRGFGRSLSHRPARWGFSRSPRLADLLARGLGCSPRLADLLDGDLVGK